MFSREEKKAFNQLFWTSFGKYMKKYEMEYGKKINWTNYKTGIKDMYIRMDADNKKAIFSIDFQHSDLGIRDLFFEQFEELKRVFHDQMRHEFIWDKEYLNTNGEHIHRVYTEIIGVNKFNKDNWLESFNFFENHIVPFHDFWSEFKEIFVILQE